MGQIWSRNDAVVRNVRKADLLIFDADGTLRRRAGGKHGAPRGPADWELLAGVQETFGLLNEMSQRIAIATNQPDVAKGRVTLDVARILLDDLLDKLGVASERRLIQLCPHDKMTSCVCRKPSPGMIIRLLDAAGVAPDRALMIGNAAIDRRTAQRAGVHYQDAGRFFGRSSKIVAPFKAITQTLSPF